LHFSRRVGKVNVAKFVGEAARWIIPHLSHEAGAENRASEDAGTES
jgi:hypothetical protein